jgi:pimeloyl-ACP methyl ester carboxylesterase
VIAPEPTSSRAWSPQEIEREWRRLRATPAGLSRPLVVFSGWRSPMIAGRTLAAKLRRLTGADSDMVLPVAFWTHWDFEAMIARALERIGRRWPTGREGSGGSTLEVDVVGVSMGGLVARAAATPAASRRFGARLAIATLYTLGTPHRGA